MTFEYPVALVGLLGLMIILWAHFRGKAKQASPLSTFFLLRAEASETRGGWNGLSAWSLLLARAATLLLLVATVAGVSWERSRGTLLLVGGHGDISSAWDEPITIVRAGYPPTVQSDLGAVPYVDGPPNWSAALALGRALAPGARVVRIPGPTKERPRVQAGAVLDGPDVVVTVVASSRPEISIAGQKLGLLNRGADWYYRGPAQPGGGNISVDGAVISALCVPDARPLRVQSDGWPRLVREVLEIIPHIEFVDKNSADWRVGRGSASGLWSPFAPNVTLFHWSAMPDRGVAPVWFEGALPVPDAVLRRWRAFEEPRAPVLWADGLVAADFGEGPQGRLRRFGFLPKDTDLPMTAAWPALFLDAVQEDRASRSRCREVQAGETLLLASESSITLTQPNGARRRLEPRQGRIAIDGLDAGGLYTLASQAMVAFIAVTPRPRDVVSSVIEAPATAGVEPERRRLIWSAAVGVLLIMMCGGLWRSSLLWGALFLCLITGLDPTQFGVERGPIVLAVDVSASMPVEETRAVVQRLEQTLGHSVSARVEGAVSAQSIRKPGEAIGPFGGATRFGPLLSTAAEVAGQSGVVVLVSDGWPRDGVASVDVPVFTVPVRADRVDAAVTGGRAVRLGEKTFVRVRVRADRPAQGLLQIGPVQTPVDLAGNGEQTIQAVLTGVMSDTIQTSLAVPKDRVSANNKRPIVVEGQRESLAVVVGPTADWAKSAGFKVRSLSAAEVSEFGADLSQARALWIADQPAADFDPMVIDRLGRWVRSGGFLVLSGRAQAFGAGGWNGTTLEALSPVLSSPGRPRERRAGVTLLVDRSGSISKEAGGLGLSSIAGLVSTIAGGLMPQDEVSVLAFGGGVETLLPPTQVRGLKGKAIPVPTIARGGTRLGPALERAERLLQATGVDEQIIIVLSDGRFADHDELIQRVKSGEGSSVRIVGLIGGDDPVREPLASLCESTGGSLRRLDERAMNVAMERVFSAVSGELLVTGGSVSPGPGWQSRIGQATPPVKARVRVQERQGARVLAAVDGEPLLAEWRVGRGRVVALATDDWALTAEQWAALLAPALMSRPGGPTVTVSGDRLIFQGHVDHRSPRGAVELTLADGSVEESRWEPIGPGRSQAALPGGPSVAMSVSSATGAGSVDVRIVTDHDRELASKPPNLDILNLQAELSGARRLTDAQDVAEVLSSRGRRGRWPLASLGAILACLLVLLDAMFWAGWRRGPFG